MSPFAAACERLLDGALRTARFGAWIGSLALVAGGPQAVVAQAPSVLPPDTVTFASGALTLRGIIYRPAGGGPFTTVLFNHGSGNDYSSQVAAVGPAYAKLGYAFFAPARRGQWLSAATGQNILDTLNAIEKLKGREARDPLLVELMKGPQLDDVRAALAYIKAKPYVRGDRVVVSGNSFGGIVTMFAAAHLDGVIAGLNFAGAAQTWAGSPNLQKALTDAAIAARVPIFFGQAENDYDLTPSRELSAAMTKAGKPNAIRIFPPFGATTADGHAFGYFGGDAWGPVVAAFVNSPPTRQGAAVRTGGRPPRGR